ncbi:conserved hypothetical protein [Olsenella uli DSM 7084]|uniref:Uncharacterized protein n=1 Tax=Olsenella uli (strain ATCC 49627 / DSM 7084 / CCUG 31166 / CIP 109912 / JCM 12494 / LMG 11480 / NCIMB 702895 / VPI D76D-27C) TaxID=633147 RepID=E1QW02_OLSUV|nr:hypothetical protein [Olsenella uli]ADK68305.1 conserved hypothetical protein [Olsenella uli DSM 7084]
MWCGRHSWQAERKGPRGERQARGARPSWQTTASKGGGAVAVEMLAVLVAGALLALALLGRTSVRGISPARETPTRGYVYAGMHEVGGHQGVAYANGSYWVTNNNTILRYDADWDQIDQRDDALADVGGTANHLGDIDVYDGLLYAAAQHFEDGMASDLSIAVYDANTLTLQRDIQVSAASGQTECSGVAVDPAMGSLWLCSWEDGISSQYLYEYDLASGDFRRKVRLVGAPRAVQGVTCRDGALYLSADNGSASVGEPDHIYRVELADGGRSATATLELTLGDIEEDGEAEGLTFNDDARQLVIDYNCSTARVYLYDLQ